MSPAGSLYIFWFLHQTTTMNWVKNTASCCISFDSYIKPQPIAAIVEIINVVYLLIPTSNHNGEYGSNSLRPLYIFWFLHQTTTMPSPNKAYICCISFDSYIKPQQCYRVKLGHLVVYLLIPTSNHNHMMSLGYGDWLYIFWFLHQTTTLRKAFNRTFMLYIFWFLHQTTTTRMRGISVQMLYIFWFLHQTTT